MSGLLVFFTIRQIQNAESNRIRHLAGFSGRIESTIGALAERFVQIVSQESDIQQRLDRIQKATLLELQPDQRSNKESQDPTLNGGVGQRPTLTFFEPKGPELFMAFHGILGEDNPGYSRQTIHPRVVSGSPETESDEPVSDPGQDQPHEATAAETGKIILKGKPVRVVAGIDLDAVVRPMIIPEVFDNILVATPEGLVLFQQGEEELRLNDMMQIMRERWEKKKTGKNKTDPDYKRIDPITGVWEVEIAERSYHLFIQPIELRSPKQLQGVGSTAKNLIICGVISTNRLISGSFTGSPFLMFLLLSILPVGLVIWPYLKLILISPRQRFTRMDFSFLVFSTILGISLFTLMVFGFLFFHGLFQQTDRQLKALSQTLENNIRRELGDVYQLLQELNKNRELIQRLGGDKIDKIDELTAKDYFSAVKETTANYPCFHSVFWIDPNGSQWAKLPMFYYSTVKNNVANRAYNQRIVNGRPYKLDFKDMNENSGEGGPPAEMFVNVILSKTSNEDTLVVSTKGPDGEFNSIDANGRGKQEKVNLRVTAAATQLMSLKYPLLAPKYGFALVDRGGRVLIHSDPKRNLTENFVKASEENLTLSAILRERREGYLLLDYWGRNSRAFIRPISGLPWSLVTFRDTQDLRLRTFELIYDFSNAFLLYMIIIAVLTFGLRVVPRKWLRHLWHDPFMFPAYRDIGVVTFLAVLALIIVFAWDHHIVVFGTGFVLPTIMMVFAIWRLTRRRDKLDRLRKKEEEILPLEWRIERIEREKEEIKKSLSKTGFKVEDLDLLNLEDEEVLRDFISQHPFKEDEWFNDHLSIYKQLLQLRMRNWRFSQTKCKTELKDLEGRKKTGSEKAKEFEIKERELHEEIEDMRKKREETKRKLNYAKSNPLLQIKKWENEEKKNRKQEREDPHGGDQDVNRVISEKMKVQRVAWMIELLLLKKEGLQQRLDENKDTTLKKKRELLEERQKPHRHHTPKKCLLCSGGIVTAIAIGFVCWNDDIFMLAAMLISLVFTAIYLLLSHKKKLRERAFVLCLAGFLVALGLIPTFVFLKLAADRQGQFFEQDTLSGLAERLENREVRLADFDKRLPLDLESYKDALSQMRNEFLKSFDTLIEELGQDRESQSEEAIWQEGQAEGHPNQWVSRVFSSRLLPLNDLSAEPVGVDLSRFENQTRTWSAENDKFMLEWKGNWGTGKEWRLSVARWGLNRIRLPFAPTSILIGLGIFIMACLPLALAYFIARYVLFLYLPTLQPKSVTHKILDDLVDSTATEIDDHVGDESVSEKGAAASLITEDNTEKTTHPRGLGAGRSGWKWPKLYFSGWARNTTDRTKIQKGENDDNAKTEDS